MRKQSPYCLSVLALGLLLACAACEDPYAPKMDEAAIEKNNEALAALDNQCGQDSDCMITGCHRSICRAAPEASFCDHSLALTRLDQDPDTDRLRKDVEVIMRGLLQASEHHTLQVSISADQVNVWFHTSYARRELIEQRLSAMRTGGIYRWSALSPIVAHAVIQKGQNPQIRLRAADGGPALLEATIEGSDITKTRQILLAAVTDSTPPNTRWAFEVLSQTSPPVMRAWLLEPRPLVELNRLQDLTRRDDPTKPDQTLITGRFDDIGRHLLADLTPSLVGHTLLWASDDEVLASSKVTKPITDGRFELAFTSLNAYTHAQTAKLVLEQMERLRAAPTMNSRVVLNVEATKALEAHLPCYQHDPPLATCGCNPEGRCAWRDETPLKACIDDARDRK